MSQDTTLEIRAIAAVLREQAHARKRGAVIGPEFTPHARMTFAEVRAGKRYVFVCSETQLLACFRVRNRGELKQLKRWPARDTTSQDTSSQDTTSAVPQSVRDLAAMLEAYKK